MKQASLSLFLIFLFFLSYSSSVQAREILFSDTVPKEQLDLLKQDLSLDIEFTDYDATLRTLMGVKKFDKNSINDWIRSRVGYIISSQDGIKEKLYSIQKNYIYQNADVMPELEQPFRQGVFNFNPLESAFAKTPSILMANVGTLFYLLGKREKTLVGFQVRCANKDLLIIINSPRVGVLQIGDGLFRTKISKSDTTSLADSLFRLDTLIHEAHHSDGSGKSLGFMHAACPPGHSYHGFIACDRNGNGPYTLDSLWLRQGILSCIKSGRCTRAEAEKLALYALDSASRSIDKTIWDSSPEGI